MYTLLAWNPDCERAPSRPPTAAEVRAAFPSGDGRLLTYADGVLCLLVRGRS